MTNKTPRVAIPGVRASIAMTNDGQPISASRATAPDVTPWVARMYVTRVEADPDLVLACGLLSDVSTARFLLRGKWHAETRDGPRYYDRDALFFGPNAQRMPVSVRGSFATLSITLRPGVCHALGGPKVPEAVDRINSFGEKAQDLLAELDPDDDPYRWMDLGEQWIRERIEAFDRVRPDPVSQQFDRAAFANPNMKVSEFAAQVDLSARQLERVIQRDFGLLPKHVLRRARALDMAANLRGVADKDEADELALRYFDQSHLNREFVEFFGMTPTEFVRRPQPLLTISLEMRQARRLEALGRFEPGEKKPWQEDE